MLPSNTIFVAPPLMEPLAQSITHALGADLIVPEIIRFADGEIEVRLRNPEVIQGKSVCLIQSTNPPVHDALMQLLLLAQELKNAGATTITAFIPYFGYARHDESKIPGGQPSMALVVKLLQAAGINSIITIELHNSKIIPSLVIPMHSITMAPLIAEHIKQTVPSLAGVCLVAPDQGALARVEAIARILGVGYISYTKKRYAADKTKLVASRGSCKGTTAIIIDDMIDTSGTAINVCQDLHEKGYRNIFGYFVHPVLSGNAVEKLVASDFDCIFVSNSIACMNNVPKIKIFDIAKVISEVLSTYLLCKDFKCQK